FPPMRKRHAFFQDLAHYSETIVLYESPHHIMKTMEELGQYIAPDRQIVVARELTKKFEEILRGTYSMILSQLTSRKPRGEYVIVLGPKTKPNPRGLGEREASPMRPSTGSEAVGDDRSASGEFSG
ncbi:MAG: hypothetical protein HY460_02770, partial [Parcubacteria group bacterium]|nr:hypothetical protein [Parcubacteria group bacterium]